MKIRNGLVAVAALTASLTGCASADDVPAREAALRFYGAVEGGQGERACALLAPEAAESLRTGGETCAAAVAQLDLPGGEVLGVQVWGDEAQVRLTRDTVFLHRFPAGWLVRGAGCRSRGDLPYDCEVRT
ncbi:hypothetical protein FHS43_003330 [Streptosporangium becharense]|uniref:Lipoprotein n=1 Tax=Streptosporangium becharense TaxID=1816182 RepID=A0A7W9IDC8_9ACTN|nr:hypothetical protein [Streptosporangium becharense]MBB2912050.1 hypothetical protein [Streptosporangium becharense]MBB5818597.1 hypothetical protein [Streptosporangium becharense]